VLTPFTKHAEIRAQQRGIRRDVLDYLIAYGRREYDHARCEVVYLDNKAIAQLREEVGVQAANLVTAQRDVYLVIDSNGLVVTTGHRFRRVLRDKSQANLRPGRHRRARRPRSAGAREALEQVLA
jgi:hypothetical protein